LKKTTGRRDRTHRTGRTGWSKDDSMYCGYLVCIVPIGNIIHDPIDGRQI